ncbi:YiiG family protein [Brucella intermedia]|nr:YiiG family protein [Brucella intermedia]UXO86244.1 YiiG family protein [Brucella intermedia]
MTPIMKSLLTALFLSAGVCLAGCNDQKDEQSTAEVEQSSAQQQEIAKYNTYIDAANGSASFAANLADHLKYYQETLEKGRELKNYSVESPYNIKRMRETLDKALALPAEPPEIDEAAKALTAALKEVEPLNTELDSYAQANGYLADKGKKAREKDGDYVAAMAKVAAAEKDFYNGISKRDEVNTRAAFEQAQKDSVEYFRAGIIFYSKQTARLADEFFQSKGEEKTARAFGDSLNQVNKMAEGFDKKIRESRPDGCTSMMRSINSVLARGRNAIQRAERGDYKGHEFSSLSDPVAMDVRAFNQDFNNMINDFNRDRC